MTITWHLDSVNIGFFETVADRQDVRHLSCGHILTFPPETSLKLYNSYIFVIFVVVFRQKHKCRSVHVREQTQSLSLHGKSSSLNHKCNTIVALKDSVEQWPVSTEFNIYIRFLKGQHFTVKISKSNQLRLLLWRLWSMSPDSLDKMFNFVNCRVRRNLKCSLKHCLQHILNYLGHLVNSAYVIFEDIS